MLYLRARYAFSALLLWVSLTPVLSSAAPSRTQAATPVTCQRVSNAAGAGASICRDDFGVPQVYADDVSALFFAQGYAAAQDRLFQMDTYRRGAKGTAAALLGSSFLNDDIESRREGYTLQERQTMLADLSASERQILTAYTEGVNAYLAVIQSHPELLPAEFTLTRTQPQPWTVDDSVAVIVLLSRRFGEAGGRSGHELDNLALWQYLQGHNSAGEAQAIFNDLLPVNDPAAVTTVPSTTQSVNLSETPSFANVPDVAASLLAQALAQSRPQDPQAHAVILPPKLGSYSWALAPTRTASRHALLLGGPQMGFFVPNSTFSVPNFVSEIGLHGAGFDFDGVAFAGAPGVLIGASRWGAWTATSGFGDQVDVYVEGLDVSDPTRYRYNNASQPFETRQETIEVSGAPSVTLTVSRTVHGPVFAYNPAVGQALSQKRAHWLQEMHGWAALLDVARAQNPEQFQVAAAQVPVSFNLTWAGMDGHITYRQTGLQPLRPAGHDRRLPLPGDGLAEWQGILASAQMPHTSDPAQGFLMSWNNKPAPNWDNGDASDWGAVDRAQRIQSLLASTAPTMTLQGMSDVAQDIGRHDYRADALKPYLLQATSGVSLTQRQSAAVGILQSWNNRIDAGEVGATIFDAWRTQIVSDTLRGVVGPNLARFNIPIDSAADSFLLRAAQGNAAALPLAHSYFGPSGWQAAFAHALDEALDTLTQSKGADMSKWGYDPGVINFVWLGLVPVGQAPWSSRGSYLQILELGGTLPHGENILPIGQSGFVGAGPNGAPQYDPHFKDQLPLFANWQYKPMNLRPFPYQRQFIIVK